MPGHPSNEELVEELWGVTKCEFCGEPLKTEDEVAEWYNPEEEDMVLNEMGMNHKIGHAQCGLDAGYELA